MEQKPTFTRKEVIQAIKATIKHNRMQPSLHFFSGYLGLNLSDIEFDELLELEIGEQ